MSTNILVFGRVSARFTHRIVDAMVKHFDDPAVTVYLVEPPDERWDHTFERHGEVTDVIYDHQLGSDRPERPDRDYLREFEHRHGFGEVWHCIFADRKLSKDGRSHSFHDEWSPYSHQDVLSHVEARARKLEATFEEGSFDFVFGQQIAYLGGMIISVLCDSRDVGFYRMGSARVRDRMILLEDVFEQSPQVETEYRAVKGNQSGGPSSEAWEYIDDVRNGGPLYHWELPPAYESDQITSSLDIAIDQVREFVRRPRSYFTSDYYATTPPARDIFGRIWRRLRLRYQSRTVEFDDYVPDREYIYFPLQVQPEQSIMVWARYFSDFPAVVKNVAQSVPIGTEVYVKEHPNMFGIRSGSYYDELRKLPNVRVLLPSVSPRDLVRNATASVCITSSVGLESVINGTPAITLADPLYSMLESTKCIDGYDELPDTIVDCSSREADTSDVAAYVSACLDAGIPRDDSSFPKRVCELIERAQRRRSKKIS